MPTRLWNKSNKVYHADLSSEMRRKIAAKNCTNYLAMCNSLPKVYMDFEVTRHASEDSMSAFKHYSIIIQRFISLLRNRELKNHDDDFVDDDRK